MGAPSSRPSSPPPYSLALLTVPVRAVTPANDNAVPMRRWPLFGHYSCNRVTRQGVCTRGKR